MTSVEPARLLWITGLAGVGKSTLARAVIDALRARGATPLLLDGDAVRHALDPRDVAQHHDMEARRTRAWRLARLATLAAGQGVPVVVATISLFHDVQGWLRAANPRYAEVLLTAPLSTLRARDPALYGTDAQPARSVVGVDQEPQFPLQPDLLLAQEFIASHRAQQLAAVLALWDGRA